MAYLKTEKDIVNTDGLILVTPEERPGAEEPFGLTLAYSNGQTFTITFKEAMKREWLFDMIWGEVKEQRKERSAP